jgi:hypothetical protein
MSYPRVPGSHRNPSRIDAERGDHFLQGDFIATDQPDLDNFWFALVLNRTRVLAEQ